jgi:TPR repeat protein
MLISRRLLTPAFLLVTLAGCGTKLTGTTDAAAPPAADAAVAVAEVPDAAVAATADLDASVATIATTTPIIGACKPNDLADCANKCEKLKNQSSCVNLGIMYANGEGGVVRDNNKATTLFQGACNGGVGAGCERFGAALHNGSGIVADLPRAAETYKKGCDLRNASSCNQLALMNARGDGIPKDNVKAVSLYQKACDLGDAYGCGNLANRLDSGDGIARDPARAAALRKTACDKGDKQACRALAASSPDAGGGAAPPPPASTAPPSGDPTAAECQVMRRNFIDACKKDCATKTPRAACEATCGPQASVAPALAKCKAFRRTE